MKRINMMHAPDYANMQLHQMDKKLEESKKKDKAVTKGMQ